MTKVYTTKNCPRCQKLKKHLQKNDINYKEKNMTEPEARTTLTMNNVFTKSAPILQTPNKEFYTTKDLFNETRLKKQKLDQIIQEEIQKNE